MDHLRPNSLRGEFIEHSAQIPHPSWFLGVLCKRNHNYNATGQSLRNSTGHCEECRKITDRRYASKPGYREAHNERARRWQTRDRKQHRLKHLVAKKKVESRRRGFNCDLTKVYLQRLWASQKGKCYWLGVELDLSLSKNHPRKATLERLDPSQGYEIGNVVWASSFANRGRVDFPAEEFRTFLEQFTETPKRLTEEDLRGLDD